MVFVFDDLDRPIEGRTQAASGGSYSDLTVVIRSYDGFGELVSETQDGGFTLQMAYAANGALIEVTYPAGGPILGVRYVLDDNGRVASVDRKLSPLVEGVSTPV